MCDLKPGDEVVCIDARRADGLLTLRAKYTVRELRNSSEFKGYPVGPYSSTPTLVMLAELPHPVGPYDDIGFAAARFRKVQKRSTETGMEILRKALDDASVVIAAREGA